MRSSLAASFLAALAFALAPAEAWARPEIVLTFDDGPHDEYTREILDELARRDLRAVFFWVGNRLQGNDAKKRRALVGRAIGEGHLLGNHTMSHAHLCSVKLERAVREIDDAASLLESLSGMPVRLFRAPYGDDCQRRRALLEERGLVHTHWDIDPQEWRHHSVQRVVDDVTRRLMKLEGRAIVLLHDNHKVTAAALPQILDWIETENHARRAAGRPIIAIVPGTYLLEPSLDPSFFACERWLDRTAASAGRELSAALRRLIPPPVAKKSKRRESGKKRERGVRRTRGT